MRSFAEIIDLWPSPSLRSFADDIGVRYVTAQLMRHRNSIAPKYWNAVVAGAERRRISGVTLELFAKLAAEEDERPKRKRKAASSTVRAA